MAPMDGSNGTEASDCVDVPPVRLCDRQRATAVDRVLGSAGAVWSAASDQDARRVGLSPGARNTTQTAEQSSAQAHSSCEQGTGQRAQELTAQERAACEALGACENWIYGEGDPAGNCWLVKDVAGFRPAAGRTMGGAGVPRGDAQQQRS